MLKVEQIIDCASAYRNHLEGLMAVSDLSSFVIANSSKVGSAFERAVLAASALIRRNTRI